MKNNIIKNPIIFEGKNFKIYWNPHFTCFDMKININVTNPVVGEEYTKYAGWFGQSLTLHRGPKTSYYIFYDACKQIARYKNEIGYHIINFLEKNDMYNRAQKFREAAGEGAGKGVSW